MTYRILVIAMLSLLTGCAFTVRDVNVDYHYEKPVSANYTGITLSIGEIKDLRNMPNPRIFQSSQNGYGQTTTGGLQAEKNLSEIVRSALEDGLGDAHATLAESNFELTGELVDFNISYVTGVWESKQLGRMTVKLQVRNKATGEIIWKDTIIGNGSTGEWWEQGKILRLTLDDLVSRFLDDGYFKQQISKNFKRTQSPI
ncbi:hypothetical protein [Pseudomonas mediterranea]|uniref:hypothetical protein n=1 Tax=Pseudomonas mediterranea TaxID=183795 RepID=UPI0006D8BF8D|nr:hypothetical protein [Pseudomonas mediterranea]MBL0841596.1 hypothetical protein [Pseudomonas mediterranea]MDU9030225.1 hypothetical protein [Pseudomonas mediterranea]UZD98604.1 hypothetical protein LOY71_13665 [Pseudomonas mediterranea]